VTKSSTAECLTRSVSIGMRYGRRKNLRHSRTRDYAWFAAMFTEPKEERAAARTVRPLQPKLTETRTFDTRLYYGDARCAPRHLARGAGLTGSGYFFLRKAAAAAMSLPFCSHLLEGVLPRGAGRGSWRNSSFLRLVGLS